MSDRLLSIAQVTDRVPFTKVHLYRLMKRGEFPQSIKIGKRRVCWRESDIDSWVASKAARAAELRGSDD